MIRPLCLRFFFCTRFDAYQCLKVIIGVNFILGVYLLFLSGGNHDSGPFKAPSPLAQSVINKVSHALLALLYFF